MKKRIATAILLGICVLGIAAGSKDTWSYLSAVTDEKDNPIKPAVSEIEIDEPGTDPENVEWGADTKPVFIMNKAESSESDAVITPVYVRAMLVPSLTDETSSVAVDLGTMSEPKDNQMVMGVVTLHFVPDWSEHWFYKDGFFYYKDILEVGKSTTQLLSGVTLTEDTDAEKEKYQGYNFHLDVLADSVQSEGNAVEEWGVIKTADGRIATQ